MSESTLEKGFKVFLNVAFPFLGSFIGVKSPSSAQTSAGQDIREEFRYKLNRNATIATGASTLVGLGLMGLSAAGEFSTSSWLAEIVSLDDFQGFSQQYSLSGLTHVPYLDGFILSEYLLCVVLLAMLMRGLAFLATVYLEFSPKEHDKDQPVEEESRRESPVETDIKAQPSFKQDAIVKAKAAWPFYALFGDTVRYALKNPETQKSSITNASTGKKAESSISGRATPALFPPQGVASRNDRPPTASDFNTRPETASGFREPEEYEEDLVEDMPRGNIVDPQI